MFSNAVLKFHQIIPGRIYCRESCIILQKHNFRFSSFWWRKLLQVDFFILKSTKLIAYKCVHQFIDIYSYKKHHCWPEPRGTWPVLWTIFLFWWRADFSGWHSTKKETSQLGWQPKVVFHFPLLKHSTTRGTQHHTAKTQLQLRLGKLVTLWQVEIMKQVELVEKF